MGDFDFGQFKEIYEYLVDKLNDGKALTPEEKQVYDMLIGFANQGVNLTNSADFNSLNTAFNSLADEGTKAEFERLYGKGLVQDPATGQISFTQPGSIIEQYMRRGLSVNDGPTQAALSEGLKGYLKQIADNKFASMTNSYAAMTPIRGQNISAATNAGGVASTAAGRRVGAIGGAIGGARAGAGEGEGEGVGIDMSGAGKAEAPGFLDKFGPALLGLLGTAGLGVGGYLLKDWYDNKNKTPQGNDLKITEPEAQPQYGQGAMRENDPYNITEGYLGAPVNASDQPNYGLLSNTNPYASLTAQGGQQGYGGAWEQPSWMGGGQQNEYTGGAYSGPGGAGSVNYNDWNTPKVDAGQTGPGWEDYNWDSGSNNNWNSYQDAYDPYSWSGDESSGYWV